MSTTDEIAQQMKQALKAGEKERLQVLRMLLSELKVAAASGKDYDEAAVLTSYANRLKKNAEEYEKLGLGEKAEEARRELAVAEEFLPSQLEQGEIEQLVDQIIAENDLGPRDLGRAMNILMGEHAGQVDGRTAQEIVRRKLEALS